MSAPNVDLMDPRSHDSEMQYKGRLSTSACRFYEGLAARYSQETGYTWTAGDAVRCILESFKLIYEQMQEGDLLVRPYKLPPGGPDMDVMKWLAEAVPHPMRGVKKP